MRTLLMGATVALLAAAAWAQPPEGPMTVRVTDVVAEASETISLSLDDLPAATPAAGLGALDMRAAVRAQARAPAVMVEVTLQDLRAEDRAVDLDVTLPMDLTGWTWWHDINAFEPIDAASQFAERRYPLVVVTSNAGGLAMAIEPDQPVVYELRGAAEGLTLHARLGLTPLGEGDLKSAAHVRLYLYPVDAEWGFRDALATYYALFPAAFERLAMDEGQWLFAFENTRLPNPSHYAYHEGGPGGWQYDEEHGIGTYPYTEVSSRTVTMHRLPSDREDAFVAWDEYRQDQELALAGWGMRGGVADDTVARTGGRSLRCAKDDPGAWVGAVQDVMVDQQAAEPVTISGWLKAQDVTGASDREVSLYGDVLLQSGEWLFGQIAAFEPGTHDWQQATWTVETDRPVRMVRLHCLFRAGHTGTVWFDDIAITVASKPGENLALNPSFEEIGINPNVAAIDAYHVEASDGHPVFSIRTDLSSDVKPTTPLKLLRFCLNPSPYLRRAEGAELPPGPRSIENYLSMIERIPALDGAYIDSVSAWATRELDYRREHFYCVRHSFTYDPESKRVVAPGKHYTYDFLHELGEALHPLGRWVFTNIHNTMDTFLLYAVSDVPGIESSITNHERFAYIRSASYQKPAVLLNFLNLHGFEMRAKHDLHWRMAMLYGLYPSIGRRCDEAYELYGDLYRRFMPSLKRISAAGWEPVTHAVCDPPGPRVERFGSSPAEGLFFSVYNEADEDYTGKLVLDARAFGLRGTPVACDTTTGWLMPVAIAGGAATCPLPIEPAEVAVVQVGSPETIAATAQAELDEIVVDLRRLEGETPDDVAERVCELRGRIVGMDGLPPQPPTAETLEALAALCNDAGVAARTLTGETPGQALLRAMMLVARRDGAAHAPADLVISGRAVAGETGAMDLRVGGETSPDALYLMRDAAGLRVVDHEFAWPTEGYGPGMVDLFGVAGGDRPGAVMRTLAFRQAVEVELETDAPLAPAAERVLIARCHNNSSRAREITVRAEAPDPWALTPAQHTVDVPAYGSAELEFTMRAPEGQVRVLPVRVVAEAGPDSFEGETVALCGAPAQLDPNLARVEGVAVAVDSSYQGYGPAPLADGRVWPAGVQWAERAWASAESGGDHWIELAWPRPVELSRVIVYWNVEADAVYAAQSVVVKVERDGVWNPVATADPAPGEAATQILLSPTEARSIRVVQPAGMGSALRPNLMWVTEVQVGQR